MQKVISKKEIEKIVSNKKPLNENSLAIKELRELNESLQNLDEASFGEKLKYYAAKWLPSYKVGDKIFGGDKERQEMLRQIQDIMNKEAAESQSFIKTLDSDLRKNFPDFPNNLEKEDFLKGVLAISAVYDTIKKAVDDGKITSGKANEYIGNLRKYVNYVMSYQLNRTIYSTMNENYDESEDIQLGEGASSPYVQYDSDMRDEEPFMLHGEKWQFVNAIYPDGKKDIGVYRYAGDMVYSYEWFRRNVVGDKSMGELDEATMADIDADGGLSSDSVRRALGRDREVRGGAADYNEYDSEVMKGLKSNRLPIVLASIGAGLGALGWVAQTDWLREVLEFLFNKKEVVGYKDVTESITRKLSFNVEPGDGFTQTVNKTLGLNLGPNTTTDQFLNLMKQKGFGSSAEEIVRNYGIGGTSPNPAFVNDAANALNTKGALLKDVFKGVMHGKAGTLMAVNPGPFLAKQIATRVVKAAIIKTTTTGTAMALGLAAAGPYLIAAGIGLLTAGALVKLMRIKGQKSSRAATLNALLQSLRDMPVFDGGKPPVDQGDGKPPVDQGDGKPPVDQGDGKPPVDQGDGKPPVDQGDGGKKKKRTPLSDLRKVLRNLFINVYDIKKNQATIAEAVRKPNYISGKGLQSIGIDLDKADTTIFIQNMKRMMAVAKAINKLNLSAFKDDSFTRMVQNVRQSGVHDMMSRINEYIGKNKTPEFIKAFILAYNDAVKTADFKNLKKEIDKNLDTILEEFKPTPKAIEGLKNQITDYFKLLFLLFKRVNQLAAKESKTPPPTLPTPINEKKNKYSKKASSFIGKEISHLKKDKGYSQERAVAAAINVAKEKGMKVGSKKKKSKA